MHTLSSASRTCIAVVSAVECTATVWMPISWQARWMRSAISPRLAISTFPMAWERTGLGGGGGGTACRLFHDHQGLAVLHRHARFHQDAGHGAGARGANLVEGLHRLDQQQGLSLRHPGT